MKFDNKCGIQIFFGLIGSGKTTIAASICKKALKRGIRVFSNMPIKGAYILKIEEIGHYDMDDSILLIDEAGIDFDNRDYSKNFKDKKRLSWFKLVRHHHGAVFLFSQSWTDMDVKIRNLACKYWYVHRSIIPFFVSACPVKKSFGINENEKKPDDIYSIPHPLLRPFFEHRVFGPLYWKLFDSWECDKLPVKSYDHW